MKKSRDTMQYSKATLACLGVLVCTIVLYLYFLNMSVVQVVMRTEHTQTQHALQADIALLEAAYIEAQHTVSARIANLEGYDTDASKIFVSRAQTQLVFNGE